MGLNRLYQNSDGTKKIIPDEVERLKGIIESQQALIDTLLGIIEKLEKLQLAPREIHIPNQEYGDPKIPPARKYGDPPMPRPVFFWKNQENIIY